MDEPSGQHSYCSRSFCCLREVPNVRCIVLLPLFASSLVMAEDMGFPVVRRAVIVVCPSTTTSPIFLTLLFLPGYSLFAPVRQMANRKCSYYGSDKKCNVIYLLTPQRFVIFFTTVQTECRGVHKGCVVKVQFARRASCVDIARGHGIWCFEFLGSC